MDYLISRNIINAVTAGSRRLAASATPSYLSTVPGKFFHSAIQLFKALFILFCIGSGSANACRMPTRFRALSMEVWND